MRDVIGSQWPQRLPRFGFRRASFPLASDIVEQSQPCDDFYVIIDGWAAQYELLEDGSRQILDFLPAGSIAGLQPDRDTPLGLFRPGIDDRTGLQFLDGWLPPRRAIEFSACVMAGRCREPVSLPVAASSDADRSLDRQEARCCAAS